MQNPDRKTAKGFASLFPVLTSAGLHRQLIIMTKVPAMGTVKTRLASDIGSVSATYVYRRMLGGTISNTWRPNAWQTILAVNRRGSQIDQALVPSQAARMQQGTGDLGQRLERVVRHTTSRKIVIIGADAPDVTALDISDAFESLNNSDFVLGPASDGGFWLIGMTRRHAYKHLFSNVAWSAPTTFSRTKANLDALGTTALLRRLSDCDDQRSFRIHGHKIGRLVASA